MTIDLRTARYQQEKVGDAGLETYPDSSGKPRVLTASDPKARQQREAGIGQERLNAVLQELRLATPAEVDVVRRIVLAMTHNS